MTTHNNYLYPTEVNLPPHNRGDIRWRVQFFEASDLNLLWTQVNTFLDSLATDGFPWPHLSETNFNRDTVLTGVNQGDPIYTVSLTYLQVG